MTIIVFVVGVLAALSGAGVVVNSRILYSALSLVGNMICLAVLFLLLNAQFLAAVQIIIYAGAVMVLFVFIIALLSPGAGTDDDDTFQHDPRRWLGLLGVATVTGLVFYVATNGVTYDKATGVLRGAAVSRQLDAKDPTLQYSPDNVNTQVTSNGVTRGGNVQTTGEVLFTRFLLPFEITSLLLLVAAIGAVYMTRRHQPPQ